ncbi:putative adenylate-forming reductase, a natural product biosynthesis enzyme that resembles non-ribosomal peptide synthetases, yet serves to modify one substrate, rather than to condense two or more building blocks [Lyophyllum shimeji]|uniref:AMP-dependent synthetase/ligase domain-containing protein n=1 Tax=Lyophyllum shimeji TaxID=47721 RepID=A0A9P3UM03_LYOSH|nr:putative adenylate-forming reductase, a natural product biosynthesis enzyme that resembles non-ribosomal peptide synthetases, yet serves to modify one substrate, rather than to condense two or more building blocks [Lyophyllum shimeji]
MPAHSRAPSPLAHLSATDRALFYHYGIGPARPVPIPVVHHAFQHHAQTQPSAIAVEHHCALYNESITYAELDAESDRLAHSLRALPSPGPIVPGTRVCILARRSVALVVAILATLKAGAQYVPLDALTITDDTLAFVLEDATPSAVLAMDEFVHRVPRKGEVPVMSIEREMERAWVGRPNLGRVEDMSSPADGAYCIYTSGTTGRPKGVDVRHRGIANVLSGPPGNVHMSPGLRVAQLLNIAFDMGAWEILGALYNGATLCLRGNTSREWRELMRTVDVVIATPSILALHDPADYPRIKRVIVGGEPCPQALADKWARHTSFHNCCGPTEISICNTVTPAHIPGEPLAIGRPIPNTNVYILSRDPSSTRAAPVGQVGCMWVGGVGVSGGYLGLEEKTRERWRRDPFVSSSAEGDGEEGDEHRKTPNGEWARPMMFNTGDLGRWRKDGQLEHMGRADDQVKVKGFRVELDGVAMAMRAHPDVRNAVALLINGALWGFVTPSTLDLAAVRAATTVSQPSYAVPAPEHFVALEEFPMTRNGKVDKRELHAIGERKAAAGVSQSMSTAASTAPSISSSTSAAVPTLAPAPAAAMPTPSLPAPMEGAQFVLEETLKMPTVAPPSSFPAKAKADDLPSPRTPCPA